ncbi:ABC-F type ribosomal protection protein [Bacillus sp. RG28]|uniref:ABC-F type ribosomal protection protein n=1 Tax=Gottfriedia endophytica TaxID=2820819 RepID=A0A940NPC3_9BACI|nr:ABC-F type ribosomal protection protein [Gottfriedia endophytica]MBP0726321.1 ABC-F type ribosomal protection protein [Gottfriedia endophytica]
MTIVSLNKVSKNIGGQSIFENVNCEVQANEKIGLVGRNGSGKTTLFKLLTGLEKPDNGEISIKRGTNIGYLEQVPSYYNDETVLQVLEGAFSEVKRIEDQLKELENIMQSSMNERDMQKLLNQYGSLQDVFTHLGGYEVESKIMSVANGLNITPLLQKKYVVLSGGEKTKVGLGLILLQNPDLLLLDEPTNHLDLMAVEWLEKYLKEYSGTVIVISHDRTFLDQVVTKILDMEDGELTIYHMNYSGFVKEKQERLLLEFNSYQEQQKKIKKMKEAIKRLKEWANSCTPPNEGLHRRARNMERALERMEKLKRPQIDRKKVELQFSGNERSGKDVLLLKGITKRFDSRNLFVEANLNVYYLNRVCLIGQNGTGKSTLIKIALQQVNPDEGEVYVGSNVKIGYLSQTFSFPNQDQTLLDTFRDEVNVTEGDARHILAKFLFYGPSVFKKVKNLSGGEKMRLRLAQLVHQDINLLILDEPTNHLDIESREVLEDAIEQFNGTIFAVSHDRYFLNKLFDKTYWIEQEKLYFFEGNYEWAREKMEDLFLVNQTSTKDDEQKEKKVKNDKKQKSEEEIIEEMIMELEKELFQYEQQLLAESELDVLQKLHKIIEEKQKEREKLYLKLS